MHRHRLTLIDWFVPTAALLLLGLFVVLTGCSDEQKVLDVEAPGVDIEVIENTESGELTVEGEVRDE